MSAGPKSIRVTTYNVLSSSLARADYFSFCSPKYLSASYRLAKVKEKLQAEVSKNAIICLQEVSTQWAGDFHKYFASRGYHFVTGLYGNKFNGYMGVGVAFPLSEYEILDADITRIADTKNMPRKPKKEENKLVSTIKNLFYWPLYRFFKALGAIPDKPKSAWDESLTRFNQMVSVRLQHKVEGATPFVVGTYHMPCIFKIPQVMMIHCALSAKYIHNYASGAPYVYCGDFNIKPDSIMYSLLTEGDVSQEAPEYPKPVEGDEDWKCKVTPLKSAYKEFLGKEPEYTNNARIVDQEPFVETLDYIFTSSQHPWKVLDVENLAQKHPPKAQVTEPLPSEHEPSDHVLLSAELTL
jgi:mRNA deadenylase 3'-5' endonuclease subunit Ccr4